MRRWLIAMVGAVGLSVGMVVIAPGEALAQGACGAGFCSQERLGCISICGRCVAEFECSIGQNTCSSNCKCGTPGCSVT
jgi:hypothetical protein